MAASFRRLLTAIVVLTVMVPAARGADAPDLGAIARIRQEAARGSQVVDTIRNLTDVYGPRLTGSPQLKAAAAYVLDTLKSWGLGSSWYERWGPFGPGWTSDRFIALALAPQFYPLQAYPKAWTPGTTGEVIADAVLAPVQQEGDFAKYRGTLGGKFVLVSPIDPVPHTVIDSRRTYLPAELATLEQPAPPAAAPADEKAELAFARKRMEFFINENVAALLEPGHGSRGTVRVGDGRLRDDMLVGGPGFYPWPDAVAPQVVLATEQYNRIGRTLEKGIGVTLEMNIVNAYHPNEPDSVNVIAEIPGTDPAAGTVMVGAHLDSWHAGTGATDNAAGAGVVLEAMRILHATGLKMRRTVRLALWTGSEQGLQGSRAYVTQHLADPSEMLPKPAHAALSAYFNLDGGAGAIRGLYLQGDVPAGSILSKWLEPFASSGATTISPRTTEGSDHMAFDVVGIPAFHFIQDPLNYESQTRHSNLDVFEEIDPTALVENAVIVASLLYHTANRPEPLPRKALPSPNPQWTFPEPRR